MKHQEPAPIRVPALTSSISMCRPHIYFEPPQPLVPDSFSGSSPTASLVFFASSSAAFSTASSASLVTFSTVLPALSLVPPQPLPAACSTLSALPALSLAVEAHPLPDAPPGSVSPPALIRLAMPKLARSFFMFFFFRMFTS